ncbi:SIN3-HDAC complex-associated factor isoform X2 [Petromyzon marinus]|uniref:SIN3-HDAC complex-associated factor isoform X2 n=2 Tax=Petromyzon marinus TaxID=7757 RepID=UPI003F71C87E
MGIGYYAIERLELRRACGNEHHTTRDASGCDPGRARRRAVWIAGPPCPPPHHPPLHTTMFGFHRPKMYRSTDGCCICKAKSSSSRFTDSRRYQGDFKSCFGLTEARTGDICNACVLLVKRWKKLPAGSTRNWNHVVDARAGPGLKVAMKPKKMKSPFVGPKSVGQIHRIKQQLKRQSSDAHSTASSASPSQSPSYSPHSDEGSDVELGHSSTPDPALACLDRSYWKRQKVCCGIVYMGLCGEVLIDPHLFKPCCGGRPPAMPPPATPVIAAAVATAAAITGSPAAAAAAALAANPVTPQLRDDEEDW